MTSSAKIVKGLAGLRVAVFEGRRAKEMEQLIIKQGGVPLLAPSMGEAPLSQNVSALEFGEKLIRHEITVVLFLTGVGAQSLFEVLETRFPKGELLRELGRITVVARGPKSVEALRGLGVPVTLAVPDPGTWREILEIVDNSERFPPLQGLTVAVQESGVPNSELLDELKIRGARVLQVPVYRWTLPSDTKPLEDAVQTLIDGQCEVALFTNSMQVSHLFQVAEQKSLSAPLRKALSAVVVGSIGPLCSQSLHIHGVDVDVEPREPRMAQLVAEIATAAREKLQNKKARSATGNETPSRAPSSVRTTDTVLSTG